MFVVSFENIFGHTTIYGTFENETDARMWMKSDWENHIDKAEEKGDKITTWMGDDNMCGIEEIGDWSVIEVQHPIPFN